MQESVLGFTGAGWRDPWVFRGAIFVNETGSQKKGEGEADMCATTSDRGESVMDLTFLSLRLEFYWLRKYFFLQMYGWINGQMEWSNSVFHT